MNAAPSGPRHWCSGLSFEFDFVAQRDPVGADRGDLRLEAGTAAINSTAMHPHQAEAATLVKTQGINVVVSGNDPQAGAPLPSGQMPDCLNQGGSRPAPLLVGVEGQDLALLPVLPRHVREHAEQLSLDGLSDKCRMIQRADQFSQAGYPETIMPDKKLLGRSLVGGLPRTDLHRINLTAMGQAR